jgi:hypothetical protein
MTLDVDRRADSLVYCMSARNLMVPALDLQAVGVDITGTKAGRLVMRGPAEEAGRRGSYSVWTETYSSVVSHLT